jgi:hypothetical protein
MKRGRYDSVMRIRGGAVALALSSTIVACGGGKASPDAGPTCAAPPAAPALGSTTGHANPLGASATEARAGRLKPGDLPVVPGALVTWAPGDFVLANDKVALVIEDVGDSDLYDPWGGRPVGMSLMASGKMVAPANFGELFVLTGRSTIVTDHVTVINDGSDGKAAVVRASGKFAALPFFDAITSGIFRDDFADIPGAIDYVLAPGAESVDVIFHYASARPTDSSSGVVMHGFMYTKRTPSFVIGKGFGDQLNNDAYLAEIDDTGASWAYSSPDAPLGSGVSASGFVSGFTKSFTIAACSETTHTHAHIVIGGPGLDGLVAAVARDHGDTLRTITGTVTRAGAPAPGVRVHATAGATYLTRATTDAAGHYALHVPAGAVHLTAFKPGDAVVEQDVADATTTADLALPANGTITVAISEAGLGPVPARVQVLAPNHDAPRVPGNFGEPSIAADRVHVEFPTSGQITLPVPPGTWRVVVSRGYEYDLVDQRVDVAAGQTVNVAAQLHHVVDTTNAQCGDFHIHTIRSNDSGDDTLRKLASAVADGLELPVRTDHEYVGGFGAEIAALDVAKWAFSISSIEMTSFQLWGHMGVFPLEPDPTKPNAGAPQWQRFSTAAAPGTALETLSPKAVFQQVRARPEKPAIIINHPRGDTNYFNYVGYDPATGAVDSPADWDEDFKLVEVFNDSTWLANRDGTVKDWLGLLSHGRKVFAVGSSDSHGISSSPVGYPRTCIQVGTDDPRQLTANKVRDELSAGHATVSGGIYVTAKVGTVGPGDTATGVGASATVDVTVQAAPWIDVTTLEVIVDGATVQTLPITATDADPTNPVIRWHKTIAASVATAGSYVIVAAYGAQPMEPVHPDRVPFGVTNPIFLTR